MSYVPILAMPLGGDLHVTVLALSREASADELHALLRPVDSPQTARATESAHFGPDSDGRTAYVHLVASDSLTEAHNQAAALAGPLADNTYPEYRPHVTFAYAADPDDLLPAGQPVSGTYEAPGLELWYDGTRYPLREAFPSADRPVAGAQWDPLRAGFSASVLDFYGPEEDNRDVTTEEFYSPSQPRDERGRWGAGTGVRPVKVSTAAFVEAITAAHSVRKGSVTAGEMLSPPDPKYLRPSHKFLAAGGKAGFVISREGDLQQVFNASDEKGIGAHLIRHAIDKGARTLDCFDGFLPSYYSRFGFEEVGREANWTPGGPDVVYMALKSQPASSSAQTVMGSVAPSGQTSSATTSSSSADEASRSTAGPLDVETDRSVIALEFYAP